MRKQDGEEFKKLLQGTFSGYEGQRVLLQSDVLAWWWKALEPYSLQNVSAAIALHSRQSAFKPKPADLIDIINQQDGRPTADEAWPMALLAMSEGSTVVWTEETEQSWYHCYPTIEVGDKIGARMAFRQHYQKLIDHARMNGVAAKWNVSLGQDQSHRETTLKLAHQKGFLTKDWVKNLLPSPEIKGDGQHIAALVGYDGKVDAAPTESAKEKLLKLREVLAKPSKSRSDTEAERKAVEQKRRDHLAEQLQILEEARSRYQVKTA